MKHQTEEDNRFILSQKSNGSKVEKSVPKNKKKTGPVFMNSEASGKASQRNKHTTGLKEKGHLDSVQLDVFLSTPRLSHREGEMDNDCSSFDVC